jgi:hypothetical protein
MQGPTAIRDAGPAGAVNEANGEIRHSVIVVGAGISGLTTAWHLKRVGRDVALLEAREIVGGSIETEPATASSWRKGPSTSWSATRRSRSCSTGWRTGSVVSASDEAKNRYIYRHGRLVAVPTGPAAFLTTPLLSFGGRCVRCAGSCSAGAGGRTRRPSRSSRRGASGPEVADNDRERGDRGNPRRRHPQAERVRLLPRAARLRPEIVQPAGPDAAARADDDPQALQPGTAAAWKGLVSIDRGLGGLCATRSPMRSAPCSVRGARLTRIDRAATTLS